MFQKALLMMALLFVTSWANAASARRVALVIGNSRYANVTALTNPSADAQLVARSLREAGFDSVDVRLDLGKQQLDRALQQFGQSADGADVALIYYAGHGVEAGGQNYLIPVDAKLERDRDLELEATRLDTLLLITETAKLRIIVLDACRNNPFLASMQRSLRNRAVGRGLAAVEPDGETLVVYAAKAGATAADGEGTNSPFAEALARRLPQPGLEISLLFRAVRDDVLAQTGRTQEPFTYGSLSGTAFYFRPPSGTQATESASPTAAAVQPAALEQKELLYWQGAVTANTEAAYKDYLNVFPNGKFAGLARENLTRFSTPRAMPTAPVTAPLTTPALAAPTRPGLQPSFRCDGTLTYVEALICNNPQLSQLDREYSQRYFSLLRSLPPPRRQQLARWASGLLVDRNLCTNEACLFGWYDRVSLRLSSF